ncbi:MAG: GxxExxY protein [Pseudomonadota bacterium]
MTAARGYDPSAEEQRRWATAGWDENRIAQEVVDAAYTVHRALGSGLLESVYEVTLAYELASRGLDVSRQVSVPVRYRGITLEDGFRLDLLVNNKVIVEIKSVEKTALVHKKQTLTYLRLADKRLGLLINFSAPLLKDGISRIANGMPEPR